MKKAKIIIIILCLFIFKSISSSDFFLTKKTSLEFDGDKGTDAVIKKIDTTNFLLAYSGSSDRGWAVILTVNVGAETITPKTPFEFDNSTGKEPALANIDATNFLLAYRGQTDTGWAVILTVNTTLGTIIKKTPFEFDGNTGKEPALMKVDDTHYLLVYRGPDSDGWAVILTVNTVTGIITKNTPFEYDTNDGATPSIEKIDNANFLVAYTGTGNNGKAIILNANTATGTITKGTPYIFDINQGLTPCVVKMNNDLSYLVAYRGQGDTGTGIVLIVDSDLITMNTLTSFIYDMQRGLTPSVLKIDNLNYFVAYTKINNDGVATPLTADIASGTIDPGPTIEFDSTAGLVPSLEKVDSKNFIVAYTGPGDDGWITLLGVIPKIYLTSGTYTSSVKDAGQTAHWEKINWKENTPDSTDIKFQVRSGNNNPPTGDFLGPDNTSASYFTDPDGPDGIGNTLGVMDNRFFQYKSYFSTGDSTLTPKLYNVTVTFSISLPNANFKTYIYKWEEKFE